MRKNLKYLVAASCLTLSVSSFADEATEKKEVLMQAKRYSQGVACSTTFEIDEDDMYEKITSVKDVHRMHKREEGAEDKTYIVLWGGDFGCSGGNGGRSVLTEFYRWSDTHPFLMAERDILEQINIDKHVINGRFIENVKVLDSVVVITAGKPGENDFNNPTERYKYTIIYDAHKGWKLIKSQKLPSDQTAI